MTEAKLENFLVDIYIRGYRLKPLATDWGYPQVTDLIADMLSGEIGTEVLTDMIKRFNLTDHDVKIFFED